MHVHRGARGLAAGLLAVLGSAAPAPAQSGAMIGVEPQLQLLGPSLATGNWTRISGNLTPQLQAIGRGQFPASLNPGPGTTRLPDATIRAIDGAFNALTPDIAAEATRQLVEQSPTVPFAQFALGMKLQAEQGPDAARPLGAGFDDIFASANRGIPQAQTVIDKLYLDTTKSVQNWGTARTGLEAQLRSGAARGSESVLAQYFQYGFGGPADPGRAETYWRQAAATDNAVSLLGFGNFLLEQNRPQEAAVYIQRAAGQGLEDGIVADFGLALAGGSATGFAAALARLLQVAEFGGAQAAVTAGDYYAGLTPPDLVAAARYYRLAADAATALPAYRAMGAGRLGRLYLEHPDALEGASVEAAVPLLNGAAAAGDAVGLLGLAEYAISLENYPRAYAYASRAAELGDDDIARRANQFRGAACLADTRLHCIPVPVFFATTRQADATSDGGFGRTEATSNAVSLGVLFANTSVTDANFARREAIFQNALDVIRQLTGSAPDPASLPTSRDTAIVFSTPPDAVVAAIHDVSARHGFGSAFVFVHGFNTSFDAAGRLAAETDENAGFPAVPMLLSWPSRANLLQYTADLGAVSTACAPLQGVFEAVGDAFTGSHVTLMAHSMGSQLAVAMVGGCGGQGTLAWHSPQKLGNLVYAAADVSQLEFNQSFATQSLAAAHITLYASADDLALRTASSWGVDDALRAGQGGDGVRLLIAGLDTVDATGLPTHGDIIDHGYVFSLPEVMADLDKVLNGDFAPADRSCIHQTPDRGLLYWAVIGGCA